MTAIISVTVPMTTREAGQNDDACIRAGLPTLQYHTHLLVNWFKCHER